MGKIKLSKIKANPNNPRLIKDDKFKKLVKSIEAFPGMLDKRPIVCVTDTDGKIYPLGGNMRLKALKELSYSEIPETWVTMADDWTEEQKREFIIKDNVGYGEWDWDDLANNWDAEQLTDWGLDIPNFEPETIEAEEDDFEVPDEIKTDIVLGDLFEIGQHRLLCGDSTDSDAVNKLMNGEKADMVFTDPPYGMNLNTNYQEIHSTSKTGSNYEKILNDEKEFDPSCIFVLDANEYFLWGADYYKHFLPKGGSWHIWDKTAGRFSGRIGNEFELCWSKKTHKREIISIEWVGYQGLNKEDTKKRMHPTQKPVNLCVHFIKDYSKKNVIDLFLGSGSTMVAAHQLKSKCYGMELDPKYCQVIIDRMKALDPELKIKKNGVEI
jgi:DNA modification methylase